MHLWIHLRMAYEAETCNENTHLTISSLQRLRKVYCVCMDGNKIKLYCQRRKHDANMQVTIVLLARTL
jgi:hypothetical protein